MAKPSKRTGIIDSGLELIHRNGFSATGVAAIADAAGAPKGSFYNYFKSKDDFGNAALHRYFEDVQSTLIETLQASDQAVPARLRNYFIRLRNYNGRTNFTRGCLIGNISAEVSAVSEATRVNLRRLLAEWTAHLTRALEQGQRDGDVRSDVAAATLAGLLLDAWQGALLRSKVERSPTALDGFIDVLLPQLTGKSAAHES